MAEWLRHRDGLGQYLDVLTDQPFRDRGLIDPAQCNTFIREHLSEDNDHSEILWSILNLELWCQRYLDGEPAGDLADRLVEATAT